MEQTPLPNESFELPDQPPPAAEPEPLATLVIPATPDVRVEDLVPTTDILEKVKALPAVVNAGARAQMLARMANGLEVKDPQTRQAADALRDMCKQHERVVGEFFNPLCDAANALHKGTTGLRSFALGDVQIAARKLGDAIAANIRAEELVKAEAARKERERLAEIERKAKLEEAEKARLEAERLTAQAELVKATTGDELAAAMIQEQAAESQMAADRATVEAATATGGPVKAEEVETSKGAVTSDNWQALPEHAETCDDMPQRDLLTLVRYVASRAAENDIAPLALLQVDWKAAKAWAKAQKSLMRVPGLRSVNPPKYSKRTSK
jgi:hypothetical protein